MRSQTEPKRWSPHPMWWGVLTFMVTMIGLKFLLNKTFTFYDVLPLILGGVAWFAANIYLRRVNDRDRNT